jgi:hypothetical protein
LAASGVSCCDSWKAAAAAAAAAAATAIVVELG